MPTAFYGVINREGRNEFQLFLALASICIGAGQIVLQDANEIMATLPWGYQMLWAWLLISGGLLLLISAAWKNPDPLAAWLEIGGLFALAAAYGAFSFLAFVQVGVGKTFGGWIGMAAALAMLSRIRRVVHVLRKETNYKERLKSEVTKQLFHEAAETAEAILPRDKGQETKPHGPPDAT